MNRLYVDPDITRASTLPSSFYTDAHYFDLAKEKIFSKTWQFCIGSEHLQESNQMVPHMLLPGLLDEPLLFVRTEERINCYSNVCTHRGNLLVHKPCTADKIKCGYHGRRFNLNGTFLSMPDFERTCNFPTAADNLSSIPCEHWGPFIFAALNPRHCFTEVFGEIQNRLAWLPVENMRLDTQRSRDYLVHAHWALYCENYLEALHIPFVHPSLREVIDCTTYTTEIYPNHNLQLALAKPGELSFNLPESALDFGKNVAAYYYWIFPNIMLNFYPWGCSVNVVQPINPSLTKVTFLSFILDAQLLGQGAGGELDEVEMEDEAVVESVQYGIRSRYYDQGRFSPTKEQGTHHFQRLVCDYLND